MPILEKKLKAVTYENAIILPSISESRLGGVVDSQGKFVKESAFEHDGLCLWGGGYEVTDADIEESEETVVFLGQLQRHWGNFLFDNLGRLWYALDNPGVKFVYCGFDVTDNEIKSSTNNYMDVFEAVGLQADQIIEITRPTRFKSVIVPELALFPGTYIYPEMMEVYRRMAIYANEKWNGEGTTSSLKLYLSRTKMPAKKETGEEEIERLFSEAGYRIVYPERVSQTRLISLINRSSSIAAIEGTITHNVVFAKPGTEIVLLRKLDYENTRQRLFDEASGVTEKYIDVYFKPFKHFPVNHDLGPYWVGARKRLLRWLKENGLKLTCSDYVYLAIRRIVNAVMYTIKCVYYRLVLKY